MAPRNGQRVQSFASPPSRFDSSGACQILGVRATAPRLMVGDVTALPVFVDVDTGVDDAMALVYLFASDDAEVIGIASTAGNVPVQQVCRNNLALLELCQITGVPVSKGSDQPVSTPLRTAEDTHGPEGLGYAELPKPS